MMEPNVVAAPLPIAAFPQDMSSFKEAQPVNATETALMPLIDDRLAVRSIANVPKFLQVLQHARTEADEALVLVILRATATASDPKLARACTSGFEKCGGLKIAVRWLREAVEWNYTDLLVLLLQVLKTLPVQLTSITEARINEPIVKLRKTAQEDKVRRAAQDLLKHWRARFTEKEKAKRAALASSAASASATTASSSAPGSAPSTPTTSSSTATATTTSAFVSLSSSAGSSSAPGSHLMTPKTAAEAALKDSAKPLKKRSIKRLDRMPFGATGSSSNGATSSTKSSGLIGNLMQRKSAKDAAAAAAQASKAKKDLDSKDNSGSESSSSNSEGNSSSNHSNNNNTSTPDKQTPASDGGEMTMQLPTIQSFKAAVTSTTTATKATKRIRWADQHGKELVQVQLIESWRDLVVHQQSHDESFRDAKMREHADERLAMREHKDREEFSVPMMHAWTTPALVLLPEGLATRRAPVVSEEATAQSARTRREMEFLVLDGEVPPVSPKEWTRTNEPHRGAALQIPLTDVDSAEAAQPEPAPQAAAAPMGAESRESEEEKALRDALGPLQRATIAGLMENEEVLPQVYEEAQRNGNRIHDGRVMEIIDQHRRAHHGPQYPPRSQQQPPHQQLQQQQRYNNQPYSKYGGYNEPPPHAADAGYDGYGRGYGPPPNEHHIPYQHQQHQHQHQQHPRGPPPMMHHGPGKRKASSMGNESGGILSDAPPPSKRLSKRGPGGSGPPQCMFFMTPTGCKHGNMCQYSHVVDGAGPPHNEYNGYPPPTGGRFGRQHHHQPSMGMRGGGGGGGRGMRSMRGGR